MKHHWFLAVLLTVSTVTCFDLFKFNPAKFKHDVEDVLLSVTKYMWATGVSGGCQKAIQHTIKSAFKVEPWALYIADSLGKVPSGILYGAANSMGHYDECLRAYTKLDNETSPFKDAGIDSISGRYCSVKMSLDGEYWLRRFTDYNSTMFNETRALIADVLEDELDLLYEINRMVDELPGFLGLCFPSVCTVKDAKALFTFLPPIIRAFMKVSINFTVASCHTKQDLMTTPIPHSTNVAITIVLAMFAFLSLSTFIDAIASDDSTSSLVKVVRCFSFRQNCRNIWRYEQNCLKRTLHGLRGISILWFVSGNFLYLHSMMLTENLLLLKDKIKDVGISFMLNYSLSEDTMLFVIAIFFSINLCSRLRSSASSRCCILASVVYRIVRSLPFVVFSLMFIVLILPYTSNGPTWDFEMIRFTNTCSSTWWFNVLHVNNYIPRKLMCIEQLWYGAMVLQGLILSSLIVTILVKKQHLGKLLILLLVLLCILLTALFSVMYDSGPTLLLREFNAGARHVYFDKVYTNLYTRGSVLALGLLCGHFLQTMSNIKIAKLKNIAGWLISVMFLMALIHATYFWNQGKRLPNTMEAAIYAALHRPLWCLPIFFIIVSCSSGHGGFATWLLSWRLWTVLSRLSYTLYVWHAYVILYSNGVARAPFFFSYDALSYLAIHHIVFAVMVSFVVSLFCEQPVLSIIRLYFSADNGDKEHIFEESYDLNEKPRLTPVLVMATKPAGFVDRVTSPAKMLD